MLVVYERIESVIINPRILEEYFDIDDATKLTKKEMSEKFSQIPMGELIDLCENHNDSHTVVTWGR